MKAAFLFLICFPVVAMSQVCGVAISVHDGDTFTFATCCEDTLKVRLRAVDCPELGQPWADSATNYTRQAVLGKELQLQRVGTDRYGRTLAVVVLPDGRKLNELLLAEGLGWVDTRFSRSKKLLGIQKMAEAQCRGLWVAPGFVKEKYVILKSKK